MVPGAFGETHVMLFRINPVSKEEKKKMSCEVAVYVRNKKKDL